MGWGDGPVGELAFQAGGREFDAQNAYYLKLKLKKKARYGSGLRK